MNEPLRPCPFCGGAADMQKDFAFGRAPVMARIGCYECRYFLGRQAHDESEAEAAVRAAWNRRTPESENEHSDSQETR